MDKNKHSYRDKLLDPRWQQVRLKIFVRDKWMCVACAETTRTLHVHHLWYQNDKEPWESPLNSLVTLCSLCHKFISPSAKTELMSELNLTLDQFSKQKDQIKEALTKWINQQQHSFITTLHINQVSKKPVSNDQNWRKSAPRAGRVWTTEEDQTLLLKFDAGLSLEEIALLLERGVFGVAVRLCKLGRNTS